MLGQNASMVCRYSLLVHNMDTLSKKDRSKLMSLVKSGNNKSTELKLARALRDNDIVGWRRRQSLIGTPDFVFKELKVAVFVDGCFWHGCPKCRRLPKSNVVFWKNKIQRNLERDKIVSSTLKRQGWKVIRIWECDLQKRLPYCVARIRKALLGARKECYGSKTVVEKRR